MASSSGIVDDSSSVTMGTEDDSKTCLVLQRSTNLNAN